MKFKKVLVFIGVLALVGILCLGIMHYRFIKLNEGTRIFKYEGAYDTLRVINGLKSLAFWGDHTAQELLGDIYAFGQGVRKNDDEAIKWYRKAASKNIGKLDRAAISEYYVAKDYKMQYYDKTKDSIFNATEAIKWYRYSALGGYPAAAETLREIYLNGKMGLSKDSIESKYWDSLATKNK